MRPQYGKFRTQIIAAIATPLRDDQSLDREGLARHVDDQGRAGLAGLLVGGTMGAMQLLSDQAYRQLVEHAAQANDGRCELLVGVGDTSLARTLDRVRFVEQFPIDGVVAVTPSFLKFTSDELRDYYRAVADQASRPLYLYDLPSVTGVKLDLDLVLEMAEHPNIAGIKCSVPWDWTRQLIDAAPAGFRVIPAQACLVDHLIRLGVRDNLDGLFALFPRLTASLVEAAEQDRWEEAAALQRDLAEIGRLLGKFGVFAASTAILQAQGVRGSVAPRPFRPLDAAKREQLLNSTVLMRHLTSRA